LASRRSAHNRVSLFQSAMTYSALLCCNSLRYTHLAWLVASQPASMLHQVHYVPHGHSYMPARHWSSQITAPGLTSFAIVGVTFLLPGAFMRQVRDFDFLFFL
jgi:hypothetical protein